MEERSSVETINFFNRKPNMFAIKGRKQDHARLPVNPPNCEIEKFVRIKAIMAFPLRLPLDIPLKKNIKRSFDLILSTIIITCFLSWLVPLIALLIKLDSKGPVFFLQKRNKKDGKVFTCIKFRTIEENDDADVSLATDEDERITKLGRFLRKHNLDYLPQFFNVWWGDMSIIGPDPQVISVNYKYEQAIEFYDYRHKVKPGITGLSQAMGFNGEIKNLQSMKNSVQLDIFYVRHWSISLDIKILLYTVRKLLSLDHSSKTN